MITKLLRNPSILSVGSAIALQGFTLLTFMLLARLLEVEQMGTWALWLTFVSIADMSRQGLVQNGLVRYSSSEPSAWGSWLTAAFVLNGLSSLVFGLLVAVTALVVGTLLHLPGLASLAVFGLPFMLIQGIGRFAEAVQVSKRDFRGIFWSNSLNGAAQFALTAILFLKKMEPSLSQLIGFQSIGLITGLFVVGLFFRGHFTFGKFERQKLVELFRFGKYVAGTNFFSMLFQRLDTLLIGAFLTPAAVALYNVATRLNSLLDLPLNSISLAQFPVMSNSLAKSQPVDAVFQATVRKLVLVLAPLSVLLILFAPKAVLIFGGETYAEAAGLLQILALAGLAKPWGRTFGMTLDAMGRSDLNFKLLLLSILLNLALMLALLPAFGAMGAAVATGLGIVLTILAGQYLLKIKWKLQNEPQTVQAGA